MTRRSRESQVGWSRYLTRRSWSSRTASPRERVEDRINEVDNMIDGRETLVGGEVMAKASLALGTNQLFVNPVKAPGVGV